MYNLVGLITNNLNQLYFTVMFIVMQKAIDHVK